MSFLSLLVFDYQDTPVFDYQDTRCY